MVKENVFQNKNEFVPENICFRQNYFQKLCNILNDSIIDYEQQIFSDQIYLKNKWEMLEWIRMLKICVN
jgi:hypothetical protein